MIKFRFDHFIGDRVHRGVEPVSFFCGGMVELRGFHPPIKANCKMLNVKGKSEYPDFTFDFYILHFTF